MRLIASFVVIAASSLALGVDFPVASAAEDATQVDVQPKQILFETSIVQVELGKSSGAETGSSILDQVAVDTQAGGKDRAIFNVDVVSAAPGDKPVNMATDELGEHANTIAFRLIDGGATDFIQTVGSLAEVKVLACPRLLVLNKHRAEIHLGGSAASRPADRNQADSSPDANPLAPKTRLRLRPFVLSDGMIRLEIHLNRQMGYADKNGVPAIDATQLTVNITIRDGTTVAIGGITDTEVVAHGTKESPSASSATKKELLVILTARTWEPPSNAEVSRPDNVSLKEQPTFTR